MRSLVSDVLPAFGVDLDEGVWVEGGFVLHPIVGEGASVGRGRCVEGVVEVGVLVVVLLPVVTLGQVHLVHQALRLLQLLLIRHLVRLGAHDSQVGMLRPGEDRIRSDYI